MTIRIEQHIPEAGYYPGQIIVDHPRERDWITEGRAVPVGNYPETATAPDGEKRKRK